MSESVARVLVALPCAAALVAMIVVLGGSDDDGGRALYVAIALAFFSLTGAAGLRLAGRGPEVRHPRLRHLTFAISAISVGEVVSTFWSADRLFGREVKTAAQITLATLQPPTSRCCSRPNDSRAGSRSMPPASAGSSRSPVLTALALVETSKPGHDVGVKPMALFAVSTCSARR